MFGPGLEGNGFIGTHPDLNDLDDANNLKYSTDFRQVYQTVMTDWLCFPEQQVQNILGGSFDTLPLGFSCSSTRSVSPHYNLPEVQMNSHGNGTFTFSLDLPKNASGQVLIYDLQGKEVAKLYRGLMLRGENQFQLNPVQYGLTPGIYIFVLRAGSSSALRKFMVM